jgi:hypothetical protein
VRVPSVLCGRAVACLRLPAALWLSISARRAVFDFRNNQFPFVINRRRGATELFESLDGGIAHVHYSFAWAATYGRMAHIFEPRTRQTPGL